MKRKTRMIDPELTFEDVVVGEAGGGIKAVKYELKDGDVIVTKSLDGKCFPLVEQDEYAKQLVRFLNAEIAFDKGSWRVVWCQPRRTYYNRMTGMHQVWVPELMECQYLDKGGNVLVVVDYEENVWTLLESFTFTDVANHCNSAYEQLREVEKVTDVQPWQRIQAAQGQQAKNPNLSVPDLF